MVALHARRTGVGRRPGGHRTVVSGCAVPSSMPRDADCAVHSTVTLRTDPAYWQRGTVPPGSPRIGLRTTQVRLAGTIVGGMRRRQPVDDAITRWGCLMWQSGHIRPLGWPGPSDSRRERQKTWSTDQWPDAARLTRTMPRPPGSAGFPAGRVAGGRYGADSPAAGYCGAAAQTAPVGGRPSGIGSAARVVSSVARYARPGAGGGRPKLWGHAARHRVPPSGSTAPGGEQRHRGVIVERAPWQRARPPAALG